MDKASSLKELTLKETPQMDLESDLEHIDMDDLGSEIDFNIDMFNPNGLKPFSNRRKCEPLMQIHEESESANSNVHSSPNENSNSLTVTDVGFKRLRLDSECSNAATFSSSPEQKVSSSMRSYPSLSTHTQSCQRYESTRRRRSRSVSFSFSNALPGTPTDSIVQDRAKYTKSNIGMTPLMAAAREGNVEKVESLLKDTDDNVNITAVDKRDFDALMYAVRDGHVKVVNLLLNHLQKQNKHFDNRRTKYGLTHVLYAALNGHKECVELLYQNSKKGKEILNCTDEYGFTPLMGAARNGHMETAKVLIELGADVEQRDRNGLTALFWAVISKNMGMVSLLVSNGAKVNTREDKNKSPLLWAVVKEETEIAQHLLGLGAKVCDAVRLYCVMDHIKKSKAKQALRRETAELKHMVPASSGV